MSKGPTDQPEKQSCATYQHQVDARETRRASSTLDENIAIERGPGTSGTSKQARLTDHAASRLAPYC
jgi:hypothetical protein